MQMHDRAAVRAFVVHGHVQEVLTGRFVAGNGLPPSSSFDSRAGSGFPIVEPVGVINQPSSIRTLILPDAPR